MRRETRRMRSMVALLAGLLAAASLLALLGGLNSSPSAAETLATLRYVSTTGSDVSDCSNDSNPCLTIQHAVEQADDSDEIRIAAGAYFGVQAHPRNDVEATGAVTQVVYISKTVFLVGGYSPDFVTWDPPAYTTTIDAVGQGRAIYVTGDISPSINSLHITGGDATGQGGDPWGGDAGAGIYVYSATTGFNDNHIYYNNVPSGAGGGMALYSSQSSLYSNHIFSNTAGNGGGMAVYHSVPYLEYNDVKNNTATLGQGGASTSMTPMEPG